MKRDGAFAALPTRSEKRSAGSALSRRISPAGSMATPARRTRKKKILRNAFDPGDAWFRTGDLMRQDAQGYFYFVDRVGDTFRWKGENVATSEVAEAICAFRGVTDANVYGVQIPGTEGRAGMAALVADELDLAAFRNHLIARLPGYARPLFLRLRST